MHAHNSRKLLLAVLLSAASATSCLAREFVEPRFWLSPGAGVAWPPAELGYGENGASDTQFLLGGILGLRLFSGVALETRAHFGSNEKLSNLDMLHGSANLTWSPIQRRIFAPFLTAGATVMDLKSDAVDETRLGYDVGAGMLARLTDQVGIRFDLRLLGYEAHDAMGSLDYRTHVELFTGLNVGFGGAPRDSDGDGIPDRADHCHNTPRGARVDAMGCPIDGDSDGVPDGLDHCEATPKGALVDERGCPMDGDGDGVFDGLDNCPDSPSASRVDRNGCPLDADGDGVYDGIDQCENTPKDCSVDANGCPTDADGDGVCDGVDACSDTPADVRVDATGCAIVLTEKETELLDTGMIRLQDVNFASGKATLQPQSEALLDEVGEILARWPELRIEVGGHTDSVGSEAFNLKLSEERAAAVRDYLLQRFQMLRAEQITSKGYGESMPVAPNDSEFDRAKNRRVEFKVLNTEALRRESEKQKLAPKH